ncbi:MAG: Bacterioferritin-associated ferredoxin [Chloroflexi bacterium]|jgi:bacterioferritin-associated ferredoxin|nr:MAG: Bacterioferritin-associated ferredoxin [Chloroflexota bacterium]
MTYMCDCKQITEEDVREWARLGFAPTAEDLIAALGFSDASSCGRCATEIHKYLVLMRLAAKEGGSASGR